MKKNVKHFAGLLIAAAIAIPAIAVADEVNFNVAIPSLTCPGNVETPNECTLTGEMMARGPENLVKPVKYYCEVLYTYIAAETSQSAIRFNGRLIHRGEITLKNGKARKSLSEAVTLDLPRKAQKIDLSSIACYIEK